MKYRSFNILKVWAEFRDFIDFFFYNLKHEVKETRFTISRITNYFRSLIVLDLILRLILHLYLITVITENTVHCGAQICVKVCYKASVTRNPGLIIQLRSALPLKLINFQLILLSRWINIVCHRVCIFLYPFTSTRKLFSLQYS